MEYYEYNNSTYFDDHQGYYGGYGDADHVSPDGSIHRLLAPAGGAPTVDYAVISVVVITLGLVLAIEVLRHQLDVVASGNPFFQTVLELMYREPIFVDVHFMLFYTAVFNAIQSCLVRLLAGRRTDRAWIQTEDIDIGHYVAIRKEVDRLENKLQRGNATDWQNNASSHSSAYSDNDNESCWSSFREAVSSLAFKIQHPHLSRRKDKLLVPIRFHELRAHFLKSNNLPPKFKVSHYLKRSLTSVLLDFVHISSAAWILLMATANLLYFLSGMLLNVTEDSVEVEEFLMYIFFAMMVIFVVIAFILFFKMKSVFSQISRMKLTIFDSEGSMKQTFRRGASPLDSKSIDQLTLFWGNNPHFIIVATQYMQFGYALGLAMIFTYYKDFSAKYSLVNPNYLLLTLLISYLIFLHLVSVIIPWYTLCTSMGQLVNKERLHETLAKLKLSEEIRYKETLEEERKAEEEIARRKKEIEEKRAEAAAEASKVSSLTTNVSQLKLLKLYSYTLYLKTFFLQEVPHASEQRKGSAGMLSAFRNRSSGAIDVGPSESSDPHTLEQRKWSVGKMRVFGRGDAFDDGTKSWLGHTRKKSLSDGVQFMSNIGDLNLLRTSSTSPTNSARLSDAAAQQLCAADEDEPLPDGSLDKTADLRWDRPVHTRDRRERRRLQKSISDNVTFMKAMDSADLFAHENLPWQPEKPFPALKESIVEGHHDVDRTLNKEGRDKGPDTGCSPRPRSNSLEAAKISIDDTNFVSGENPKPKNNNLPRSHADLSLGRHERKERRRLMKTQSEGVASMRSSFSNELPMLSLDSAKAQKPEKLATLSELTQMSAKDLPEVPEFSQQVMPKRRPRQRRARSSSAGVLMMRAGLTGKTGSADDMTIDVANFGSEVKEVQPKQEAMGKMGSICEKSAVNGGHPTPANVLSGHTELPLGRHERKQRRRLMKTQSEGVSSMRASLPNETIRQSLDSLKERKPEKLATLSELTQMSAKDLPEIPEFSQKVMPKRRPRARSSSAGVLLMRAGLTDNTSSDDMLRASTDDAVMANSGNESKELHPKQELVGNMMPTLPVKNRVTFSPANSTAETSLDIKEDAEIDSTASEDGESDIDDVPDALPSDKNTASTTSMMPFRSRIEATARKINLVAFFQGSRYRIISLIFGPMACFFFVARVEIFNIYAGIFVDQTGVWSSMLEPCFWAEFSLYIAMIIEMISVLVVFSTKRGRGGALFSCVAAIFGLFINCMCLALLLIAETKRCRPDDGTCNSDVFTRLLGPAPSKEPYDYPASEEIECCPDIGGRKCGGLGKIEPYTCLIALSPLRFLVAGFIVKFLGRESSEDEHLSSHKGTHGHHGPDPTTKVRDLWMAAIGVHSDIAKSFGLFSGELLQCMLGIYHEIEGKESEASVRDPESSDANNESVDHDSSQRSGQRHERENSLMDVLSDTSGKVSLLSPEHKRYDSDDFGISFDDFAYPRSRLIRKMRRCERRLLPLLDEWMVVDVVLTSHELILFDVIDGADNLQSTPDTNGGKGLSLCDVAKGRKIVSQFSLDHLDFVDIEHRAAVPGDTGVEDIEVNRSNLLEYWQGGSCTGEDYEVDTMNKRWEHVDEDRLKIHFKSSNVILYLRFMVDLKEMESKRKTLLGDTDLMHHVGTQTKVWCRTIARVRGSVNLKQHLPHFGNDGTDEIEDFIEICDRDHEGSHHGAKKIRKTLHRRSISMGI
ncbi:hypothetical protein ACHAXR_010673 [Thalassiosira sp. AJA248-18]